jgi:hypothetical protein
MLPGRTGLVVAPANPGALALALLDLMSDRHRLAGMAREAREHAARTSFDQAFLRTWELYAEVVCQGVPTAPAQPSGGAFGQGGQPGNDLLSSGHPDSGSALCAA